MGTTLYKMQARSSEDGQIYSWNALFPDRTGSGYLAAGGTGSPLDIVLAELPTATGAALIPISAAFTYPAAGASIAQSKAITLTGTLTRAGTVVVKKGATTLGAAIVTGLVWSYLWTPGAPDIGAVTLTAHAVDATNGTASDPTVAITVLQTEVPFSGTITLDASKNAYWWGTRRWDATGTAPNDYLQHDQYASIKVRYSSAGATSATLVVVPTSYIAGGANPGCQIDVIINGIYDHTSYGPYTPDGVANAQVIPLPAGTNVIVEFVTQGNGVKSLAMTSGTVLLPVLPEVSFMAIGASGTVGVWPFDPNNFVGGVFQFLYSWFGRVRTSGIFSECFNVSHFGNGITMWGVTDASTAASVAAALIVPRCTGTRKSVALLEFGAGEKQNSSSSPATFKNRLRFLVDAIRAQKPGVIIVLQTPIVINQGGSNDENATNAFGAKMQAYRDVQTSLAAEYADGKVVVFDGYLGGAEPAMTTLVSDLYDGLHCSYGGANGAVGGSGGHLHCAAYMNPRLAALAA